MIVSDRRDQVTKILRVACCGLDLLRFGLDYEFPETI